MTKIVLPEDFKISQAFIFDGTNGNPICVTKKKKEILELCMYKAVKDGNKFIPLNYFRCFCCSSLMYETIKTFESIGLWKRHKDMELGTGRVILIGVRMKGSICKQKLLQIKKELSKQTEQSTLRNHK